MKKFIEKPKSDGWASAGFFVFERKVFDYLGRRRVRPRTRAAGTPGRRGRVDGLPSRRLLLRHGHVPRIPGSERALEIGRGAVEGLGMSALFWRDRPDAGHRRDRAGRRLADSPAARSRRRRGLPGARLGAAERAGRAAALLDQRQGRPRRHLRSRRCWSACSASTRSTRSFISRRRRSSASPTAIRSRLLKANIAGHLERARSLPPLAAR